MSRPVDTARTRFLFPMAAPEAPIATAEVRVRPPDGSWKTLPEQPFFVPDLRQAWRTLSKGGSWALTTRRDHAICWLPPQRSETLEGGSATLAVALAVAAFDSAFSSPFDEIWASGQVRTDGRLESIMHLHHKLALFLDAVAPDNRVFLAPLADHDQLDVLRRERPDAFVEQEFSPTGPALSRVDRPTVIWLGADDIPALLRSLRRRPLAKRRLLATAVMLCLIAGLFAFGVGARSEARAVARGQIEPLKSELLRSVHNELWFLGATFTQTAFAKRPLLLDAAGRGVKLRFCMADPTGSQFGASARSFGQSENELLNEAKLTVSHFATLYKLLKPEQRSKLEVGVADHVFMAGEYYFDPYGSDAALVRVAHVWGTDTPELPGDLFRAQSDLLAQHRELAKEVLAKCLPLRFDDLPPWAR